MAAGAARGIRRGLSRRAAARGRHVRGFCTAKRVAERPLRNQRQKGAGHGRSAESNAQADSRDSALASRGDCSRMGHGHTSKQRGSHAEVREARSGAAFAASAPQTGLGVKVSRAAKRVALACVRMYQVLLGPFLGGGCRFYPSCSKYAYEAIERFGARRGAWLGMKRVLRCRPFSTHGYDPVPEELGGRAGKSLPAMGHDGRAVEVLR